MEGFLEVNAGGDVSGNELFTEAVGDFGVKPPEDAGEGELER